MFYMALLWALLAAILHMPVLADLTQDVVFAEGFKSLEEGLFNNLNPIHFTLEPWPQHWVPADCKQMVEAQNLTAADLAVWNVKYDDCADPWIMCEHKDAPLNLTTMADLFGRLPVRMRSVIRHLVAIPGPGWAGNAGDNILFSGTVGRISVFAHEVGHSIDSHGYPNIITTENFHKSRIWLDNFAKDKAVADPYANTDQAENHSQEVVIALYDFVVPGGVGSITPNWTAISHQYATIQGFVGADGDTLVPGGTCENRHNNSEPVPMPGNATNIGPAPNVSLTGPVGRYSFVPVPAVINASILEDDGVVRHGQIGMSY